MRLRVCLRRLRLRLRRWWKVESSVDGATNLARFVASYHKFTARRWNEQEKSFIDEAGGVVGGYDFHFYSKGCWAGNTERTELPPSLMEAQWYGINSVWDYGRVDAYLDLVAAHHMSKWGPKVKPVIITEFGHQSISPQHGPWENEFKPWLYMER